MLINLSCFTCCRYRLVIKWRIETFWGCDGRLISDRRTARYFAFDAVITDLGWKWYGSCDETAVDSAATAPAVYLMCWRGFSRGETLAFWLGLHHPHCPSAQILPHQRCVTFSFSCSTALASWLKPMPSRFSFPNLPPLTSSLNLLSLPPLGSSVAHIVSNPFSLLPPSYPDQPHYSS